MVALNLVKESNARLRELGPGLVGLFVGGTSGIGEFTAKAFVQNTISPRVYLVGRNASAAERIIEECKALNKDGRVIFIKADVSELKEVDRACKEIQSKEKHVNLLVQTQGNLNIRGRDESPEGLDRKLVLNFYSRMRFTSNLLPQLRTATTLPPNFARAVSILAAGTEGAINTDDLELAKSFSGMKCANHGVVMNDFMAEEYAAREPGITFMHGFPLVVDTGIARELPFWARIGARALITVLSPFAVVSAEETAQRQLFHATSAMYPPRTPVPGASTASGVSLAEGLQISQGADENIGSGGYLSNWNSDAIKQKNLLRSYREKGYGKIIWDHTIDVFERVEKINAGTV